MSQFATNASAQAQTETALQVGDACQTPQVQELLVLHKSSSLFVQDACHVPRAYFLSRCGMIPEQPVS